MVNMKCCGTRLSSSPLRAGFPGRTLTCFAARLITHGAIAQATCSKQLDWTAQECANVDKKKLFVGMTREMIDAEKPHSCVRGKLPAHREPGMIQFVCEQHR
jgi:hypothetical protein